MSIMYIKVTNKTGSIINYLKTKNDIINSGFASSIWESANSSIDTYLLRAINNVNYTNGSCSCILYTF